METNLAQTEPKPTLHGQVDSEALAESEVDVDAELEVDLDADAELEAIMEAEIESEANGEAVLNAEALNRIENECEGDAECIKDEIKGLTKINHEAANGAHLSIE